MFHAILRDRVTRIKYADAQYMLFLCQFDIDLLFIFGIMNGIAEIIADDLFHRIFIGIDKDLLIVCKRQADVILLQEDLHGLDHAFQQGNDVEMIVLHLVIAGLDLVEGDHGQDHTVHFLGFINNNITVKLTTFLIIRNALCQPFRIALDQSDRRFQFV